MWSTCLVYKTQQCVVKPVVKVDFFFIVRVQHDNILVIYFGITRVVCKESRHQGPLNTLRVNWNASSVLEVIGVRPRCVSKWGQPDGSF